MENLFTDVWEDARESLYGLSTTYGRANNTNNNSNNKNNIYQN